MTLRNSISGFLVFLMLGMQLLLAQHATVHLNENVHIFASSEKHQPNDKGHQGHEKICEICLFDKSLSHILFTSQADITFSLGRESLVADFFIIGHPEYRAHAYLSRAPPLFLS